MPISIHPKKGQLLLCDFSQGFKTPEMVKSGRPVIVLRSKNNLVTVAALSTKEPTKLEKYHFKIPPLELPKTSFFQNKESWLKGDMIYTVGFHRLNLIQLPKVRGQTKRQYFTQRLSLTTLTEIEKCVVNGIGLSRLEKYL